MYYTKPTAKLLWEFLDHKYKIENARARKWIVGRFLDYKMVDSKTVVIQVQELQVIIHEIHAEKMVISESFQVATVIEKLLHGWKDFKNYLKHKRKEMSMEDLIVILRIEEDNRGFEKKINVATEKANMVEHAKSFKAKKTNSGKGKPKKTNKKKEANMVDDISKEMGDIDLCATVSEVNLVGSNPREWWIDTGATRHVCSDKEIFSSLKAFDAGEKLYMGNSATSTIEREGTVILKMTSEKDMTLKNSGMFVGKGYVTDGLFMLNVMSVKDDNVMKNSSAYLLESPNLWHARLGHKSKDEAIDKFKIYKEEVERQQTETIKTIRSDRGGEYVEPFGEFCSQHGIIHEVTAPYSPQSNGVDERKNRTLNEMMNAMLLSSRLPQLMWGEAILSANNILNITMRKNKDVSPYEMWEKKKSSYKHLKVWGCIAKIPEIQKNTIMESRNASFFETTFPCNPRNEHPTTSKRTHESIDDENENDESEDENVGVVRRSKRQRTEKSFGSDFMTYLLEEGDPKTYKEAVTSPDGPMWKEALKNEVDSIL
ncbi:uncharacterized protein LOC135150440 [Daucus carota subsp. sativus]|uniref:uncharacterized protein LOC135150440 n=1 Tax=Daucus carota subsp. sativus TaxID=79200 RepID=UPI00308270C7